MLSAVGSPAPPLPLPCSQQRFVCGERFTEADLRLFPTIIRFDTAYATLFKCCKRRVADYPHLQAWMRDVHQLEVPGSGMQIKVGGGRIG
jgi:putative glutathione S-transferase